MTVADFVAMTRDSLDLAAQQEMAYWARWMFWVTCVSLVLSAVALLSLWTSLKQTREALTTTKALAHAETRAYVHATTAEHYVGNGYKLVIHLENVGATPAPNFNVAAKVIKAKVGEIGETIERALPVSNFGLKGWNSLGPSSKPTTVSIAPAEVGDNDLVSQMAVGLDGYVFLLVGTVRYSDIYGTFFESDFAFFSRSTFGTMLENSNAFQRAPASLRSYVPVRA
ncbi:hypothetical protein [Kaistia terrae]|uniref:Uncharacterized protein n=1 Tax=Kaistia terrae TaxID=537017 RepID=A0ABW0Q1I0_9HYPH|nr:hypothetical protein [Kaistia terrae]MCX5579465.1 hypothetical protein [Kaistia terrae]